ncbi:MAG: hypothetical protein M1826_003418 [Phylliscum demangeonii]|nr:MAG: hypothetical protein M1826_003418 [Phylliscum demangeonii]
MAAPAALVIPAVKRHTATVIMAHGLGDTVSLAENFRLRRRFEHVAFVFPNAPTIPISGNMGFRMPGWYDIRSFTDVTQSSVDEAGIRRSQAHLHALIAAEVRDRHIAADRIVLGGFSQGGAMALVAGITCPARLAGIFALSAYMLLPTQLRAMVPPENANGQTPVWMAHGEADPLVRCEWGRASAERLRTWGWQVEWKTYPHLAHSADPQEMDDLEHWLEQRLPPTAAAAAADVDVHPGASNEPPRAGRAAAAAAAAETEEA